MPRRSWYTVGRMRAVAGERSDIENLMPLLVADLAQCPMVGRCGYCYLPSHVHKTMVVEGIARHSSELDGLSFNQGKHETFSRQAGNDMFQSVTKL